MKIRFCSRGRRKGSFARIKRNRRRRHHEAVDHLPGQTDDADHIQFPVEVQHHKPLHMLQADNAYLFFSMQVSNFRYAQFLYGFQPVQQFRHYAQSQSIAISLFVNI